MERAIEGIESGRYQWIAFTSINAVRAIRERFEQRGLDARHLAGLKIAAIGEATAAALQDFGVRADLLPPAEAQSSAGLLEVWPDRDPELDPIGRVFLPRADIATEKLVAGLTELGWEVDDITAYRTVRAAPPAAEIREAIKTGGFDAVVFTSSSTVRNLVGIAGKPHATTVIAAIGPETANTAVEHGLKVAVQPAQSKIEPWSQPWPSTVSRCVRPRWTAASAPGGRRSGAAPGGGGPQPSHDAPAPTAVKPGHTKARGGVPGPSGCPGPAGLRGRGPEAAAGHHLDAGVYQQTLDTLPAVIEQAVSAGLGAVMLFGVPQHKDAIGSGATDPQGILSRAVEVARTAAAGPTGRAGGPVPGRVHRPRTLRRALRS